MAYMYVERGEQGNFFLCVKAEVIKYDRANLLLGSVWGLIILAHLRMTAPPGKNT